MDSRVLSLLTALVEAERTIIRLDETKYSDTNIRTKRQVSFQMFDFSSIPTPVDKEVGSDAKMKIGIHAIESVIEIVDEIVNNRNEALIESACRIHTFFEFLSSDDEETEFVREVCYKYEDKFGLTYLQSCWYHYVVDNLQIHWW